ncbi:MAG TPA: hypothetical protein VN688_14845 [Gemmataceae bacterium]|nr:hypothetical protein [Gemmataceae bacterium]
MARNPVSAASSLASAVRTFRRPWPLLLAGLGCTVIGLLFSQTPYVPMRLLFLGIGLLLAAIAVSRRLETASWELEDRAESAGLLAVSAFVALLSFLGMEERWDSGRLFLGVLIGLALFGSFVVLLPRTGRRIVAVILVVLHFGGILTAITAVPPRNEPAPWLSMQSWTRIYRHYLTFAYLTNAYHFYSPDPGPPTLLWFHVEYADGSARWIKLPNRRESPVALCHQRMLAAAEGTNQPAGLPFPQEQIPGWEIKFQRKYELLPGTPHPPLEDILTRREIGATFAFIDPNDGRPAPIRLVEDELPPIVNQYSEPQEMARRLIASYARHIARTSPHSKDPAIAVKSVRVYRVTHTLITPRELSEGKDPLDPTTFVPFYMGKHDIDGKLLDPKDPFLYWHLPIVNVPKRYPDAHLFVREAQPGPFKLVDFVEIHATQSDKIQKANTPK